MPRSNLNLDGFFPFPSPPFSFVVQTLTALPSQINAGTTVEYVRTVSDYPATAGWSFELIIQGAKKAVIAATAVGADFKVTITATVTGTLTPGIYKFIERVTKGAEIHDLALPEVIEVFPDFKAATEGTLEEIAQKNLAAIRAALAGRIPADMENFSIAGRIVAKTPQRELLQMEATWAARVKALKNKGRFDTPVRAVISGSLRP